MIGLYKRAIASRGGSLQEGYRKWIMVEEVPAAGIYGVFTWWSEYDDHSCGEHYHLIWWSSDKDTSIEYAVTYQRHGESVLFKEK